MSSRKSSVTPSQVSLGPDRDLNSEQETNTEELIGKANQIVTKTLDSVASSNPVQDPNPVFDSTLNLPAAVQKDNMDSDRAALFDLINAADESKANIDEVVSLVSDPVTPRAESPNVSDKIRDFEARSRSGSGSNAGSEKSIKSASVRSLKSRHSSKRSRSSSKSSSASVVSIQASNVPVVQVQPAEDAEANATFVVSEPPLAQEQMAEQEQVFSRQSSKSSRASQKNSLARSAILNDLRSASSTCFVPIEPLDEAEELSSALRDVESSEQEVTRSYISFRKIIENGDLRKDGKKLFDLLEMKNLLHQKEQMQVLNENLKEYIGQNENMDKNIQLLVNQIREIEVNEEAQNQQNTTEALKDINERKKQVEAEQDEVKKLRTKSSQLDLGNQVLRDETEEIELECDFLKKKIERMSKKIEQAEAILENAEEEYEPIKQSYVVLNKEYESVKEANKKRLRKLMMARKRLGCDPVEECDHRSDVNKSLENVLATYRAKVMRQKEKLMRKDVNELEREIQVQQQEFNKLEHEIRDLHVAEDNLNNDMYELENSLKFVEMQRDEVNARLEQTGALHQAKMEKLEAKLAKETEACQGYEHELENSYKYLRQVLLKEAGEKERLDVELMKMSAMLHQGLLKNNPVLEKSLEQAGYDKVHDEEAVADQVMSRRASLRSGSFSSEKSGEKHSGVIV